MKYYLPVLFILAAFTINAQETIRKYVYFGYNQSVLTADAKATIDEMMRPLDVKSITKVECYGYADSEGDEAANKLLSENRVASVQQYIVSKGVAPEKFVTEGFGESNPAASNATDEGKQRNRRVEIAITFNAAPVMSQELPQSSAPMRDASVKTPSVVQSMKRLPLTGINVQSFTFNCDKGFEVRGKQGTQLTFHPHSFLDGNGDFVTGKITIRLIEVYSKSEMINQQLSTVSDGRLLESGGMIYVSAYDGNNKLRFDNSAHYEIAFPTQNPVTGMQLFDGDTSGNVVNWTVQPVPVTKSVYEGDVSANTRTLNEYVFTSSKMGWINCDHFLGETNLTSVFVDAGDTTGVCYCLVFKDINSVMMIGSRDRGIEFLNVPIGHKATVLVFKKTPAETWFATKDITVSENNTEKIVLQQLSEAAFQKRIAAFN